MDIVKVNLSELKPDPNNARKHSLQNIEAIQQNLIENPQYRPFVVQKGTNKICIGNGMYEAMKALNIKEGWVEYRDLDDKQFARLSVADNRTAELAEWDEDILQQIISDCGDDMAIPGFGDDVSFNLDDDKEITEDEVPEITEEVVSVLGDVWILGKHRLMCGDSTDVNAMGKLLYGQKADMVFTDPPYNYNYGNIKHPKFKMREIANDNMDHESFRNFCTDWILSIKENVIGCVYICAGPSMDGRIMFTVADEVLHNSTVIIWNKDQFTLGRGKYQNKYEPIWFGWVESGSSFTEDRTLTNVWDIDRPKKSELHPTMKPVQLIVTALKHNPKSQKVLDMFGGSGSTLIACEQLDRTCYMMELDPKYVDVIIKRWQNLTGKQAINETTKQIFNKATC